MSNPTDKTDAPPAPISADRLMAWATDARFDDIEAAWLEDMDALPTEGAFWDRWVRAMGRAGGKPRAEALLGLLGERLLERGKPRAVRRIVAAVAQLFPESDAMRDLLVRALKAIHGKIEAFDEILARSDLTGATPLPEAIRKYNAWFRLTPNQVYQHGDWGEGVVRSLDVDAARVTIEFPGQAPKTIAIQGVRQRLKYLAPKRFLARRAREPEVLRALADSDAPALVRAALADAPDAQLKPADLKTLLTPFLIETRAWSAWWTRARHDLRLDPYVDFDASRGARATITLRPTPKTFEEEIEEQFLAPDADPSTQADLIDQLRQRRDALKDADALIERMTDQLAHQAERTREAPVALRWQIECMKADLGEMGAATTNDTASILAEIADDYTALLDMEHADYAVRALEAVMARDGDDAITTLERAATIFPRADVKLAQAIWRTLGDATHHDRAVEAIQALMDDPPANAETYLWAVRALLGDAWPHLSETFPPEAVVPELVDAAEDWCELAQDTDAKPQRVAAARKLLTRTRTLLAAGHCAAISHAAEAMTREAATRLTRMIESSEAWPETFRDQAERAIRLARRAQDEPEQSATPAATPSSEHLCTAFGYNKQSAVLRELTSEKIPANAHAIELARAEGDLRENAGYQYAKEEQKLLLQQQSTLVDLLSRARIVGPDEIATDRVGFGTRLRVRNIERDAEETWTVLGRWEADPDRHVLSAQAPLAQQFQSHRVGENVTIQHPGGGSTDYEILALENALLDPEWSGEKQPIPKT